ncbi:hypothetical protein PsAD46_01358 [Pseudovibrio sp. Ad46]|nr:hypothetical protein PsAD46_01358 [Pseudovibrio sp. Ad46]KZK97233.1 hypothetical protein PsAD26_05361 [Pseudovibrio sp. Ad26]
MHTTETGFVSSSVDEESLSCSCCEEVVQAPLPSGPIERGCPGSGLLAQIADHKINRINDLMPWCYAAKSA